MAKKEIADERRFTLRLSDIESKAIDELKPLLQKTTDSSVLREIIVSYKSLHENCKEEQRKTCRLEREIKAVDEKISGFLNALQELDFGNVLNLIKKEK